MDECTCRNFPRFEHTILHKAQSCIRLFRLLVPNSLPTESGPFSIASVHIELETFELENLPPYVALSYEWGPEIEDEIYINGCPHAIRRNLWRFLAHAPYHLRGTWIWADQICIAQSSDSEKSHQVRLMGEIYRNATEVIVWLGHISTELCHHSPTFSDEDLELLNQSSNWSRLWVVQEIMLAQVVKIMTAVTLVRSWGMDDLFHDDVSMTSKYGQLYNMYAGGALRDGRMSLNNVLFVCEEKLCSQRLDVIFAVQSIVQPDQRITVDYNLEPKEVFFATLNKVLLKDCSVWLGWYSRIDHWWLGGKYCRYHRRMTGEDFSRQDFEDHVRRFYRYRLGMRTYATLRHLLIFLQESKFARHLRQGWLWSWWRYRRMVWLWNDITGRVWRKGNITSTD